MQKTAPCLLLLLAGTLACAQTQAPKGRTRLSVLCYWQNYAEIVMTRLGNSPPSTGCEKYRDPAHCDTTAPEMFGDAMNGKRDWERVIANGSIYTLSCKHGCKILLTPGSAYVAETDGKMMWITIERADNKNLLETFEVYDVSPIKEEARRQ